MFCRDPLEMRMHRVPQHTSCRMNIWIINEQKSTVQTFWRLPSSGGGFEAGFGLGKTNSTHCDDASRGIAQQVQAPAAGQNSVLLCVEREPKRILSNFPLLFQTWLQHMERKSTRRTFCLAKALWLQKCLMCWMRAGQKPRILNFLLYLDNLRGIWG